MVSKQTNAFVDPKSAEKERQEAVDFARRELSAKGIHYPLYDYKMSPTQNYDAMREYSIKESNLIAQHIKSKIAIREKLVPAKPLPQRQFARPYYDD